MSLAAPSHQGDGMVLIYAGLCTIAAASVAFLVLRNSQKDVKKETRDVVLKRARSDADAIKYPQGELNIYFGSQTGTSEGFANSLADEAKRKGFNASVVDLEDFKPEELQACGRAIFLMATYGEGDPTDNAVAFMKWLKETVDNSDDPEVVLAGLHFAVFGLGNTQYEHYNRTGKLVNEGIAALGARRMCEYGEGDDDGTLEEDFDSWRDTLWKSLTAELGDMDTNGDGDEVYAMEVPELPFQLRYVSGREAAAAPPSESEAASSTRFFWQSKQATITVNRELRGAGADGSTRHIEVNIEGTGLEYLTADNLAVCPHNPTEMVETLAKSQGYDLSSVIVLEYHLSKGHKASFPTPCTVRDVLTRYLDIGGVPRKSVVEALLPFISDSEERRHLLYLVSKDGRAELRTYITESHRTLFELICHSFPSARIPLDHLIHLVPHLHPRDYTIASSSNVHPTSAHLTVAVLRQTCGTNKNGETRLYNGVCSTYLSTLESGLPQPCHVFVRPSSFRLPSDDSKPIIMVGPGTGIAPMRALLQERQHRKATGDNILYFGCRRECDYLYREELEDMARSGVITALRTAFSRQHTSKVYVQMLLMEHADETWRLLSKEKGSMYVCGGTAMGADVHSAVMSICTKVGKMKENKAKEFMQALHREGRYVQELWS